MVDAPFLEVFKVRLDGALSDLIELKMSLLMAGGVVGLDGPEGPLQPKPFCDTMIL